jgi:hypothetical protein
MMYQVKKTVNDELVFTSRLVGSIQAAEFMLKSIATQESFIGEVSKSGQLVDIEKKTVLWSPSDNGVSYRDEKDNLTEIIITNQNTKEP